MSSSGSRNILLIIDPQIDFHDKEDEKGSLPIPNSHEDSKEIARMIRANKDNIDDIYVTMDSHHVSNCSF